MVSAGILGMVLGVSLSWGGLWSPLSFGDVSPLWVLQEAPLGVCHHFLNSRGCPWALTKKKEPWDRSLGGLGRRRGPQRDFEIAKQRLVIIGF